MNPVTDLLDRRQLEAVVQHAMDTLAKVGIFCENPEALALLRDAGQQEREGRVLLDEALVRRGLETAPSRVVVYDRDGEPALDLGGRRVHFDPGSAALFVLDPGTGRRRLATSDDGRDLAWVAQACKHLAAQSTGLVPDDVPRDIADRHRLMVALRNCTKPIITGTFLKDGFAVMRDMLAAVRGGADALRQKPLAIFDCCPTPPLKWSDLTCQALLDCARAGIPAELVAMPMAGATAPVTLREVVVQQCAENLSGIALHQLCTPGAPIIYGGCPSAMDMRKGTTPMGAIETMMVDMASAQVGRHLGLPTHAYMGLSDAKSGDWQAGMESGVGMVLAALAGVNMVSGAGLLDFVNCLSLEKLVLDDQACGMALRLARGIEPRSDADTVDLLDQVVASEHFLSNPHTMKHFRQELFFPSGVIDRGSYGEWEKHGDDAMSAAQSEVQKILGRGNPAPLEPDLEAELQAMMAAEARRVGASLPG